MAAFVPKRESSPSVPLAEGSQSAPIVTPETPYSLPPPPPPDYAPSVSMPLQAPPDARPTPEGFQYGQYPQQGYGWGAPAADATPHQAASDAAPEPTTQADSNSDNETTWQPDESAPTAWPTAPEAAVSTDTENQESEVFEPGLLTRAAARLTTQTVVGGRHFKNSLRYVASDTLVALRATEEMPARAVKDPREGLNIPLAVTGDNVLGALRVEYPDFDEVELERMSQGILPPAMLELGPSPESDGSKEDRSEPEQRVALRQASPPELRAPGVSAESLRGSIVARRQREAREQEAADKERAKREREITPFKYDIVTVASRRLERLLYRSGFSTNTRRALNLGSRTPTFDTTHGFWSGVTQGLKNHASELEGTIAQPPLPKGSSRLRQRLVTDEDQERYDDEGSQIERAAAKETFDTMFAYETAAEHVEALRKETGLEFNRHIITMKNKAGVERYYLNEDGEALLLSHATVQTPINPRRLDLTPRTEEYIAGDHLISPKALVIDDFLKHTTAPNMQLQILLQRTGGGSFLIYETSEFVSTETETPEEAVGSLSRLAVVCLTPEGTNQALFGLTGEQRANVGQLKGFARSGLEQSEVMEKFGRQLDDQTPHGVMRFGRAYLAKREIEAGVPTVIRSGRQAGTQQVEVIEADSASAIERRYR
jgi:hypothetical protein